MISLSVTTRSERGKKARLNGGMVPAVVYGPAGKNVSLQVDEKEFKKVFRTAGESSLIELAIDGAKDKKAVLVHEIQRDPVSGQVIHVDFFQPSLTQEVQVAIPLVFEGVAPAEKDLGGTLMKNISEIEVSALPQNLPREIVVDITGLTTFQDHILVKDLKVPANVKVLKSADEIVVSVLEPQKIEEELAAEITENVEDIEKVEKPKKEEEVVAEEPEPKTQNPKSNT